MADITLRILGQEPLPLNLGSDNSETLSVGSGVTEGRLQEVLTDYVPKSDIDTTLSISGDVAEAKATGDAIAEINAKLSDILPSDSASGAIASFSDGADNVPVKSLSVTIEPKQSGSGTPSPDNVRPISGWNETNVVRCGKNLFDASSVSTTHTSNWGISYADDVLTIEHKNTYSTGTPRLPLNLPEGTYTIKCESATGIFQINKNGAYLVQVDTTARQFTVTAGDTYNAYFYNASATTMTFTKIQLEVGTEPTDYVPYTGETHTIPLPSTVYGGTLDVTNGTLVVDRGYLKKNTADMDNGENYPGWKNSGVIDIVGSGLNKWLPTALTNVSPTGVSAVCVNTTNRNDILFLDKSYFHKTQTEWKALAMDIQFVIPLATPITIPLTPTEIKTLLGYNNIFADSGDVAVVYSADIAKYIDKRLGA